MRYGKIVIDGYICAVIIGGGMEIAEGEYNAILAKVQSIPTAPDGYEYRLRSADLEWVPVELPTEPEAELTDEEAMNILLGGGEE